MIKRIGVNQWIPQARLAEVRADGIVEVDAEALFCARHAVVVGVPGAFTPVCTEKHLPDFIRNADVLMRSGYDLVACLAPNDPWTLRRWVAEIDPQRKIRYFSDGNMELSRKMGLTETRADLFLGERTARFLMMVRDGVVERLTVEPLVEEVSCTRCQDILL